jgi:hypothetical protein
MRTHAIVATLGVGLAGGACLADNAEWSTGDLGNNVIEDAGAFEVFAVLKEPSNVDPATMVVKYGLWNSPEVNVDVYINDVFLGSFFADVGYITPGPEFAEFDVTGLLVHDDNKIVCTGNGANDGDYVVGQIDISYCTGGSCFADCDGNGLLNILDFVCFQAEWQNQTGAGDCDGNGLYNILDFVCFQGEFVKGCP